MIKVTQICSATFLLIVLVFSIDGTTSCPASESSEGLGSLSALFSTLKLLSLVRGGTIDSGYYHNATDDERLFSIDIHEQGQGKFQRFTTPNSLKRGTDSFEPPKTQLVKNRRHRPLDYKDILQCRSPPRTWSGDDIEKDKMKDPMDEEEDDGHLFSTRNLPNVDSRGKLDGTRALPHSPVVYQFYSRSRGRGHPSDSMHFILMGPNVDHWKAVGQILASRGFNAIACERVDGEKPSGKIENEEDSPNLVLEILDALKWNRAILVGCDSESILAMETAMMLAPDRVAGLVLCGDLTEVTRFSSEAGVDVLDSFLRRVLVCPFLIVWDGDSPSVVPGSSAHAALETADSDTRCLILGGGSASHRTKPEQFAWILTRFVEEKLELSQRKSQVTNNNNDVRRVWRENSSGFLRTLNMPFGVNTLVSPEGRLLLGRAVAAALFYIAMMKVVVIQYGLLRAGLIGIKSKYDSVDALRKRLFQAIGAFFLNYGYIPRLFHVKRATDDDEDERQGGAIVLPSPSPAAEDDKKKTTNVEEGGSADPKKLLEDDETEDGTSKTDDSGVDIDDGATQEDNDRLKFKRPFFFLDNVVT